MKKIEDLNAKQKQLFDILVKLGDSKELALKTVLETKENDSKMYEFAYYS